MSRGRTGQKFSLSTQYLEVDELMAIFETSVAIESLAFGFRHR